MSKEFRLIPFGKKQTAVNAERQHYYLSLDEFSDIMEQADFQVRFLAGFVYRLAQKYDIKSDKNIRIMRSPDEIVKYLFRQDADCLMFTSPEHMPVVLKRKELGWVRDMEEFSNWLTVHWDSDILVIAVS